MWAMELKSYEWDLSNIAESSPKVTSTDSFGFSQLFQILSLQYSEISYSVSTPYQSPSSAVVSKLYDCDKEPKPKIASKWRGNV